MKRLIATLHVLIACQVWAEPLTCSGAKACEKMWSDSQAAVSKISMMRIRILTSDRIETYPANMPGTLGVTVTKTPVGEDSYEIKYRFDCFQANDCELREVGERWFDMSVRHPKPF